MTTPQEWILSTDFNIEDIKLHINTAQNDMVPLHRHLTSVHRDRRVTPDEKTVFLNGDRSDCRLENLGFRATKRIAP